MADHFFKLPTCIFILLFCFSLKLYSQLNAVESRVIYNNYINEADYWLYVDSIQFAEKLYDKALGLFIKPYPVDLYQVAKCKCRLGKPNEAKENLFNAGTFGLPFVEVGILKVDSVLFSTCFKDQYSAILDSVSSIVAEVLKRDSAHRSMLLNYVNSMVELEQVFLKSSDTISLDSIHENFIQTTIKYGYPGYARVGTDIASIILLHLSKDNYKKTFALWETAWINAELTSFELTQMMEYYDHKHRKEGIPYVSSHSCRPIRKESDYPIIIENRLKLGVSIYFKYPAKVPWAKRQYTEWMQNKELIQKYSLLKD